MVLNKLLFLIECSWYKTLLVNALANHNSWLFSKPTKDQNSLLCHSHFFEKPCVTRERTAAKYTGIKANNSGKRQ